MKSKVKDKNDAYMDFLAMIRKSWTFAKLTDKEQQKFIEVMFDYSDCVSGTYKQRYKAYQAMYESFLTALDYKAIGWRENNN